MTYRTLNPATGEPIREYPETSWNEAERAAEGSRGAFRGWSETSFADRGAFVRGLAELLRKKKGEYASLMTLEMGKPIRQAEAEIEKCVWGCEFYAENAAKFLGEEVIPTDAGKSYIRYDPLGVIFGIMPWNFPFWQVFRFAIPAIMAGNVVLLKHAPNVPGCAVAIEEIFRKAGGPEGVFRNLFLSNESAARLIASPYIEGVSLTGSGRTGGEVASVAGRNLKKVVLELGGSDPFIVFEDADIDKAVAGGIHARMLNSGQSCIAAKRFIVSAKIFGRFEEKFLEAVQALKVGDPADPQTDIGPLAREDLLTNLVRQVDESVKKGARLLAGGKRISGNGFFFPPAVLKEVRPGMPVFDEETFGPVACLIECGSDDEAVELANKTSYGLGASLWTKDVAKAEARARRIEAGAVFINGTVKSDPRLPFGGIKRSGFGRELSAAGIREFTNIKTVWVA